MRDIPWRFTSSAQMSTAALNHRRTTRQGGHALADSPAKETGDALLWWQAYCRAENDEVDELHSRADGGDDHARRQLASWLGDRGRAQEALALIRPLADAGDDTAQLWLARWLAECDQAGELYQRADAGNDHALYELVGWLATHDRLTDLHELIGAERGLAALAAFWRSWQVNMDVLRLLADAGDDDARQQLASWLSRFGDINELQQRAEAGDDHARRQLANSPKR